MPFRRDVLDGGGLRGLLGDGDGEPEGLDPALDPLAEGTGGEQVPSGFEQWVTATALLGPRRRAMRR